MTFGKRLAYIRKKRKMSQDDLAEKVGISRQILHKYEADISDPRLFVFVCLADALGVSLEYLARGGDDEI